jgi:putative transposase
MKYEAIFIYKAQHSVRKMCKALGLKEAGYYQWLKRLDKQLKKRENEKTIAEFVGKVFNENDKVYGYRKMKRELATQGLHLSEYRVRKIMRENGYLPVVVEKYRPAHNGKSDGKYFEDKLKQVFETSEPNKVWVGDITYIKTVIGYVYLAIIIDLFNREVVGYSISKNINTELVCAALGNAIARTGLKRLCGLIFHSDRGTQYSSKLFQSMLEKNGIIGSMSRPSCPYDNACSESFFSLAKRERIYRKEYIGLDDVKRDMFQYIELFYNRKRIHSKLGYMSPVEYRLAMAA